MDRRDRLADRKKNSWMDGEIERKKERKTERKKESKKERKKDRKKERQTDRKKEINERKKRKKERRKKERKKITVGLPMVVYRLNLELGISLPSPRLLLWKKYRR